MERDLLLPDLCLHMLWFTCCASPYPSPQRQPCPRKMHLSTKHFSCTLPLIPRKHGMGSRDFSLSQGGFQPFSHALHKASLNHGICRARTD